MSIQIVDKVQVFLKDKHTRNQVLVIVALLIFITFAIFSDYGLLHSIKLQSKNANMHKQIIAEKQLTDSLKNHIIRLRYDTLFIERVAREKYGLVKSGEIIFTVDEDENEN